MWQSDVEGWMKVSNGQNTFPSGSRFNVANAGSTKSIPAPLGKLSRKPDMIVWRESRGAKPFFFRRFSCDMLLPYLDAGQSHHVAYKCA